MKDETLKYYETYKQDPNKGMNELLAECKIRLSKLIIDVEIEDGYDEVVYLRELCFEVPQSKLLKDQYEAYRIFSGKIQGSSFLHDVIDKTKKYKAICDRYHIKEDVASGRYSTPLLILGLILLLPFYFVGRTIFAPLERFIENFVKTKVYEFCWWKGQRKNKKSKEESKTNIKRKFSDFIMKKEYNLQIIP